jgi:Cu/Zn superoxide dismutase
MKYLTFATFVILFHTVSLHSAHLHEEGLDAVDIHHGHDHHH